MKKNLLLTAAMLVGMTAYAQTGADYMKAMKAADVNIAFDVNAEGKAYHVNWGMDAAWNWDWNINRGVAFIGKEQLAIGRVAYQPTELVIDNGDGTYELTTAQKSAMKSRCDNIKKLTGVTRINITADQDAYLNEDHPEYRTNYLGNWKEWYKCLKASVKYCQELGMEVYSVSPFNEPDYGDGYTWGWLEGNKSDFLQVCKWIREDSFFDGIRISGGNTLNCDQALPWYNALKDYVDEGNTHQLAGSLENYATFFQTVKADGKVATADELHNVGEAIVGVNYGMENGIWWGFDSKARGQFCIDSNEGVRIGYGENADAWTSGAVYRNETTGEVHGYLGSSERQATSSSFAFISQTKDVFFNGYGPTRMFVYDVPGGTGYQKGQINAERLFDITWGEDVAPGVIDGTYQIMNASSKKMLTYNGTSNVQSVTRKTSGTSQQWKVYPSYTDGDISYWFIDNANASSSITKVNLNVLNNSLSAGAGVICYDAGHSANEQWYLKYAQDGYYYIISRLSNKYLYCGSTTSGSNVTLQNAPDESTTTSNLKKYLWRFMPLDAKADTKAPEAPSGLSAKQRIGSVELSWTAPTDDDALTYTILRSELSAFDGSPIEYNTIGRGDTLTTFIDNTAIAGQQYAYKVIAVDYAGNRSEASEVLQAAPLTQKALIGQWQFDGDLTDNSANQLDASLYGTEKFSQSALLMKSGSHSIKFESNAYVMLPYSVAHQDEITIATWVRQSQSGNWMRIFDFGNGTDQYMFLTPTSGSEMRFVMKNGGDEQILTNGKALSKASWHHVAVTLKPITTPAGEKEGAVQAILYLDGENIAESNDFTIKPSDIAPSICYIGRSMFTADPLFNGNIDDFRIYNYALTADEIAAIMTDLDTVSKDVNDTYEEVVSTGIDDIHVTNGKASDDSSHTAPRTSYDLNGRPATATDKGILINNGKKVFVK